MDTEKLSRLETAREARTDRRKGSAIRGEGEKEGRVSLKRVVGLYPGESSSTGKKKLGSSLTKTNIKMNRNDIMEDGEKVPRGCL